MPPPNRRRRITRRRHRNSLVPVIPRLFISEVFEASLANIITPALRFGRIIIQSHDIELDEDLPQPVPDHIVESLPIVQVADEQVDAKISCAICCDPFKLEESVRQLPACAHMYHEGCIKPWLKLRNTCPICRSSVSEPENDHNANLVDNNELNGIIDLTGTAATIDDIEAIVEDVVEVFDNCFQH